MKDNIKTADEILNKWYKPLSKIGDIASIQLTEAMKEYAEQFIDLAAENFNDPDDIMGTSKDYTRRTILKLKQLIK